MKKCDEGDDSPTMPKFNVQLNHIDRPKQESQVESSSEQINPFRVSLRATGNNTSVLTQKEETNELNGNSPTQQEMDHGDENGRCSVLSNESTMSTASTTNSVARGWNPCSFYTNTSGAAGGFKRVSAPRGKVTSISTTSSVRKPSNPFLVGKVRTGSLPNLAPTPSIDQFAPVSAPNSASPLTPSKPQSFFAPSKQTPAKPAATQPWAPKPVSAPTPRAVPTPPSKPANIQARSPSPLGFHSRQNSAPSTAPTPKGFSGVKAPKSNYQIQMPREPRQEFKSNGGSTNFYSIVFSSPKIVTVKDNS